MQARSYDVQIGTQKLDQAPSVDCTIKPNILKALEKRTNTFSHRETKEQIRAIVDPLNSSICGARQMRMTRHFPATRREIRGDLIASQGLLERAGYIRSAGAAGIYSLLPLGWRVHQKICEIIFGEMEREGVQNLQLPILQPRELWEKSGRWAQYRKTKTMFTTTEFHTGAEFGLAPTAEEIVTTLTAEETLGWRNLPIILHQIGPKFRDELKPRMGLLRCREFVMSDAYSFDRSEEEMMKSYNLVRQIYARIFKRVGLKNCISVQADSGAIGGNGSVKFMALSEAGEDVLLTCNKCDYGANAEQAESAYIKPTYDTEMRPMRRVSTPGIKTVDELLQFFPGVKPEDMVKTIIFSAYPNSSNSYEVAVCIRSDLEVNKTKLKNLLVVDEIEPAIPSIVEKATGAAVGFAGPIGLTNVRKIIFDKSVEGMTNFLCGCNLTNFHTLDVNIARDFTAPDRYCELHTARSGDPCVACDGGQLQTSRGIEVGHVFMLQTQYAKALDARYQDENSNTLSLWMGRYGIGTTRLMQAIVEQNRDEKGIIWPQAVAPYSVYVVVANSDDAKQSELASQVERCLLDADISILLDDRPQRAGQKFNDADLIGCPLRLTIGKRAADNIVEIRHRHVPQTTEVSLAQLLAAVRTALVAT
jgi:prolyl-tRNA synthetase